MDDNEGNVKKDQKKLLMNFIRRIRQLFLEFV